MARTSFCFIMNQGQQPTSLPKFKSDTFTNTGPTIRLRLGQERFDQERLGQEQKLHTPPTRLYSHICPLPSVSDMQTLEGERSEHQQTRAWLQREMTTSQWLHEERTKTIQSREQACRWMDVYIYRCLPRIISLHGHAKPKLISFLRATIFKHTMRYTLGLRHE